MWKPAPLLLLVLFALAGCGGDGGSEGTVGGTLPGCANAGQPVDLPSSLPRSRCRRAR